MTSPPAAVRAPGPRGRALRSLLGLVRGPALVVVCATLAALGGVACSEGAKSPAEAYGRLSDAVGARDARKLWDALDQETQWSWMTIRRTHREAYDIVLSNFPEDERPRLARRFEVGATADSDRGLFAARVTPALWERLARALPKAPPALSTTGPEATAPAADGGTLIFRVGPKSGRWGFAGLAQEAEEEKRRALADLESMRASAADYERAVTRGGR